METLKQCFKCKKSKLLSEFYKHPDMPDGTVNKCKECNKLDNKKNWHDKIEEKKEYDNYRQRYSIQRIFNSRYYLIRKRSTKKSRINYSCYGKEFLSKNEWNNWCYKEENYKKFMIYYNKWVQSNFKKRLAPSIDRINNKIGYKVENLQWLSQSENASKYTS